MGVGSRPPSVSGRIPLSVPTDLLRQGLPFHQFPHLCLIPLSGNPRFHRCLWSDIGCNIALGLVLWGTLQPWAGPVGGEGCAVSAQLPPLSGPALACGCLDWREDLPQGPVHGGTHTMGGFLAPVSGPPTPTTYHNIARYI